MTARKIAIFTDSFYPNVDGVAYRVREMSEELARRGFQVRVYFPGRISNVERYGAYDAVSQKGFKFALYPQYRIPLISGYAFEDAIKFSPDIIHSHTPVSMGRLSVKVARRLELTPYATFHTFINDPETIQKYVHIGRRFSIALSKSLNIYLRRFYARFSWVAAPSEHTKKVLEEIGIGKVIRQDIGIDLRAYRNLPSQEEAKRMLGISPEIKVALYMGRIGAEKNLEVLIKASPELSEKGIRTVICGTGPYLEKLRNMASSSGSNVIFKGFVPEDQKPLYYRCADVFCNPSLFENQSAVDIEAMACGTPILVPKRSSQYEFIKAGKAGEAYDSESDIPDLADEIISRRKEYNPSAIAESYSVEGYVDRLLASYGIS